MKLFKSIYLTPLFLLFFVSNNFAVNSHKVNPGLSETMTVGDYVDMDFKTLKSKTDQKLNLGNRIEFLVNKKMLKKALKDKTITKDAEFRAGDGYHFRFWPFLIGMLFGLLGLILVAIFVRRPKKNAIISCLIGMLVWGVIVALGWA